MKTYLLGAFGVIFLSVLVGLLVPEGKLKKSVNLILRLVCISVLIQPVAKIFKLPETQQSNSYDYDYVCAVYSQNQSQLVTQKVKEDLGYDCVCVVEICYEEGEIREKGVTVQGNFEESGTFEIITEYLCGLGYINITVNGTGD